jgi:hypothetical protein
MIRALVHSAADLFNSDGAFWILAMDGVLLIPVLFAVFFYPVAVLAGVAAIAVVTIVPLVVMRVLHARRHHP